MRLKRNGTLRPVWASALRRRSPIGSALLIALMCSAAAFAGCRRDMQIQPRYDTYAATNFFDDGRSARQPVPGTVARGYLRIDDHLYKGKIDGKDADTFPFPITANDILRGQQRFNIYCSPCHDYTGQRARHDRAARISAAALVPHRPAAAGSGGPFLRRDDEWIRQHVQLRGTSDSGRSLADRRLHSRAAIEPARNAGGCARRSAGEIDGAEIMAETQSPNFDRADSRVRDRGLLSAARICP